MATPSPAALPTRQQLDEIDALLKRMLTLPPLPGEPAEPEPPPAPAVVYPAPTVREVPPPRDPLPGEPVVREWRAEWPAPTPQPASVVAWGSPVTAGPPTAFAASPAPVPVAAPPVYAVPVPAEPVVFAAPVPGQPPPSNVPTPAALPVQFLLLLNGTFNLLTYLLGPPGAWVRGSGRNALGWAGILMLLAAGVWAAGEWAGYEWPAVDLSRFGISK
jgi:hypothetical protein